MSSLTGLVPDFMQPLGARAYFKYVDARGGVNGRRLTLLVYDDQWDVTRNAALTRQAFESDRVFAFVANFAPLSSHGGVAYMEQNGIPVIGGDLINLKSWGRSPLYYPQSYLESVAGGRLAGRWAVDIGCQRVVGASLSADESRSWTKSFEVGMRDRGGPPFVYAPDVSLAETDYTPYVAAAKSHKADCITFAGQAVHLARWRKAMAQQDYQARMIHASTAYDRQYLDTARPQNEGDYVMVQYDLLENAGTNPAVQEFVEQSARFEPRMRQTGYALLAWVTGEIAAEAVKRAGDQLTRQHIVEVLDSFSNFDTGITPRLTFGPGPKLGAPCGNMAQIRDGAFVMAKVNLCL